MNLKKTISSLIVFITCCHPFYTVIEVEAAFQHEANIKDKIQTYFSMEDSVISEKKLNNLVHFLSYIPSDHFTSLESINVNDVHTDPRGKANSKKIILNLEKIDSPEELLAVFIHELAHTVDLGNLQKGRLKGKFQAFSWESPEKEKPNSDRLDFVSNYARSNAWEDFAESYVFYIIRGKTFDDWRRTNQTLNRKYNFLRQHLFDRKSFIEADMMPVLSREQENWDATLLHFDMKKLFRFMARQKSERETVSRMRHTGRARHVKSTS